MATKKIKNKKRARRMRVKRGVRGKISGTSQRPRLSVFRSNRNIYAQLVDDLAGHTLAAASSLEGSTEEGTPIDIARAVGTRLAERAQEAGIAVAVFDRNGYQYHGRVQAVAEGARQGGLRL